jgi:cardiolipin synthase
MYKKWFGFLLRRRVVVAFLLLIQIAVIVVLLLYRSENSWIFNGLMTAISVIVAVRIIANRTKGAYKLTWVFQILLFPIFGGLFYLLFQFQMSKMKYNKRINHYKYISEPLYLLPGNLYSSETQLQRKYLPQMNYLQKFAGFPVYTHTRTQFLSSGEEKFKAMLLELEKAEQYIFLEYFIIESGIMWDSILKILKAKAAQGIDVRLIYDDVGCLFLLPKDYPTQLEAYGIKCIAFNRFNPLFSAKQNNRDHRKICVVDGKVAITGGVNLADEYINHIEKYGHWKDAAILLEGHGAWSFTLIFLEMWYLASNIEENYAAFYPWKIEKCQVQSDGLVQPYSDSPLDDENVGEHVYLQIINNAKDYVYINTPYLIIDDSMVSALCLAAKSGVDVRIVTPNKYDKWIVHVTTRSYYRELIKAGVKIYEYTNGFNHGKTFVSDHCVATVGTTNLDFRSLYLHFECGVLLFDNSAIHNIYKDFIKTLEISRLVKEDDYTGNILLNLAQDFLRVFAPLM